MKKKINILENFILICVSILVLNSAIFGQSNSDLTLDFTPGFEYSGLVLSSGGNTLYNDIVDLGLEINLRHVIKDEKTTFFFHGWDLNGEDVNNYISSAQGISHYAGPHYANLAELWLEQTFFKEKISLLFGLYDVSSEFDTKETADLFLNPSFGTGAEFASSSDFGPSIFPLTSLSLRLTYNLNAGDLFQFVYTINEPGKYNFPNPNHAHSLSNSGHYFVGEYHHSFEKSLLKLGGWFNDSEFIDIKTEKNIKKGNFGFYAIYENAVENTQIRSFSYYLRAGYSSPNLNRFNLNLSGAFIIHNLIFSKDALGLGFSSLRTSDEFFNKRYPDVNYRNKLETIFELIYKITPFNLISIHPNLQYIIHPADFPEDENGLVWGLKFSIIY